MGEDPPPSESRDDPHGADLWLVPFFRDSTLWPVLVTAAGAFTRSSIYLDAVATTGSSVTSTGSWAADAGAA